MYCSLNRKYTSASVWIAHRDCHWNTTAGIVTGVLLHKFMFSTQSFYPKMPKAKSKGRSYVKTSAALPALLDIPADDVQEISSQGDDDQWDVIPVGRKKKGNQKRHFLFTQKQRGQSY